MPHIKEIHCENYIWLRHWHYDASKGKTKVMMLCSQWYQESKVFMHITAQGKQRNDAYRTEATVLKNTVCEEEQ